MMAVFQMLAEMIRPEEFLRLVAFAELVHVVEVVGADIPLRRVVGEFFSAIAAGVGVRGVGGRVEGGFDAGEHGAGPGVLAQVEGVLVAFGFVFVFEAIRAVGAGVLLFCFVDPMQASVKILNVRIK